MDQKIALFAIGGWSHLNLIPEGFGLFFSPKAFDGGEGGGGQRRFEQCWKKMRSPFEHLVETFCQFYAFTIGLYEIFDPNPLLNNAKKTGKFGHP